MIDCKAEQHLKRIREISEMFDATYPDMSALLARGGEVIFNGNGADDQSSPRQEVEYYKSMVGRTVREQPLDVGQLHYRS